MPLPLNLKCVPADCEAKIPNKRENSFNALLAHFSIPTSPGSPVRPQATSSSLWISSVDKQACRLPVYIFKSAHEIIWNTQPKHIDNINYASCWYKSSHTCNGIVKLPLFMLRFLDNHKSSLFSNSCLFTISISISCWLAYIGILIRNSEIRSTLGRILKFRYLWLHFLRARVLSM